MAEKQVAVVIDFYNTAVSATAPLYLCGRGPLTATVSGAAVQFEPCLVTPIVITTSIPIDVGHSVRGSPPGGTIQFALNDTTRPYLKYAAKGRTVSIYEGNFGDAFSALTLVFAGRVLEVQHDTYRATISISGARLDADTPLVNAVFDEPSPAEIVGRPQPMTWGTAYSVPVVLVFPDIYVWRIATTGFSIDGVNILPLVNAVRVGGVAWDKVSAGTPPGPGQWRQYGDIDIQLGGTTDNGEIRCDAQAPDPAVYPVFDTAALVSTAVAITGASVDDARQADLRAAAPFLVGFHTFTDLTNIQDALDAIMAGIIGWWCESAAGKIIAGVHNQPVEPSVMTLTDVEILSCSLEAVIPPAWRIRVEYKRNWHPGTQFFSAVTEAETQAQSAPGIIAPPREDASIKTANPRAVDIPLVRSLLVTEIDALTIQDRAHQAFGVERRLYSVSAFLTTPPDLFAVVRLTYKDINTLCRVFSVGRSVGGGPHQLQLWG